MLLHRCFECFEVSWSILIGMYTVFSTLKPGVGDAMALFRIFPFGAARLPQRALRQPAHWSEEGLPCLPSLANLASPSSSDRIASLCNFHVRGELLTPILSHFKPQAGVVQTERPVILHPCVGARRAPTILLILPHGRQSCLHPDNPHVLIIRRRVRPLAFDYIP
jgi:hypothetical protein